MRVLEEQKERNDDTRGYGTVHGEEDESSLELNIRMCVACWLYDYEVRRLIADFEVWPREAAVPPLDRILMQCPCSVVTCLTNITTCCIDR